MRQAQLEVRLATPDDADRLASIYGPACVDGVASFELEPPDPHEMALRVERTLETHPWLVAADVDHGGRVIGFAYGSRHRERAAYRWSVDVTVYVDPDETGRGVGRELYARLLPVLRAQGFHAAHAGIALPNPGSVALHESYGFEPVGVYREVGFKHGAWRDVGWWRRGLAPQTSPPTEPVALPALKELETILGTPTG